MPTTEANPAITTAAHCPLCDALLDPAHPDSCPKCDWVAHPHGEHHAATGTIRDKFAVVLSVVPGLGHFYKGHKMTGVLLFIGGFFAWMVAFVASTATAGFGILLALLYWVGIMLQVYFIEDLALEKKPSGMN